MLISLFAGCGSESEPVVPAAPHLDSTTAAAGEVEWTAPLHPEVEFYATHYSVGAVGSVGRHENSDWQPGSKGSKFGSSCGQPGEAQYGTMAEYKGTLAGSDQYEVVVSYAAEGKSASFTKTYNYRGQDIEFWSDSDWRIGMRPSTGIEPGD